MTSDQSSQKRFPAMCCEEPFRVFFPLGLLCGVIGLALWPLFLWGAIPLYPGLAHARLMIEGFMGAFIIGFLGTAGPRLLGARYFSAIEVGSLLALHLASTAAHVAGRLAIGDALYSATIVLLILYLGRRLASCDELPPPAFVLVGFGLVNGAAGAAMTAWATLGSSWPWLYPFGSLALSQGFVLLPMLGVGTFLFPRFLGFPIGEQTELRRATPAWKRKALIAAIVSMAIVGSFAVESFGHIRAAGLIRFSVAFLYAATQMPAVLKFGRGPFIGQCIRIGMWSLLLGLLWPVFLPAYRVTGLHVVFIGGFMLIVFAVATRVILGHSGQVQLCRKPLSFLVIASILLVLGMLTRIGADFMPRLEGRNVHLIYAAILCVGAALVWGIRVMPRVVIPDTEEEPFPANRGGNEP